MTQAQSKSYGGVKKKLMGAVCMLLVASIMVVSSTYAWFTLSTAPEITGISTSVGANGNLEMALLNGSENGATDTDTYADLTKIKSAVGDSVATTNDAKKSNITWGNLVDLSTGYGLEQIKLMPAAVKYAEGGTTNLDKASMLATAQYGTDGRVKDVDGTTVSAVYNEGFKYSDTQSYGVRAVGVASNVTAREAAFNSAKNSYRISVANTQRAVNDNSAAFMDIAMGLLGDSNNVSYDLDRSKINGMIAIANGMLKDFYGMDIAMKNAILAQAAQNKTAVDEEQFKAIQTALAGVGTASALQEKLALTETFMPGSTPDGVTAYVADAVAAEKTLTDTITGLNEALKTIKDGVTTANVQTQVEALLGESLPHVTFKTPTPVKVYMTGGVLGKLAEYHGTFLLTAVSGAAQAYAGYGHKVTGTEGAADSWQDDTAKLAAVTTAVSNLQYEADAGADTTITDTYGYVLDMAFRTNAARSYLKLQTAGAQRIYQDGSTNADTQGSGSNITFTYGEGEEAVTADQATKLLQAVRVVFFNPEDGSIYATAKLSTPNMTTAGQAKADLVVDNPVGGEADKIVDMTQNQATKVSILVYLDGENIDNAAVSNGSKTGTAMKLNLQFSSSAELVPMENSALKNGTGTGTVVQP